MRPLRRLSVLAMALIASTTLVMACSSTPDATDDDQRLEFGAAEDLLQSDDVLLAGRVEFNELTKLTPLLQRLAQTADHPLLRDLADVSPDALGYLERNYDLSEELTALDDNRPTYVLVSDKGNQSFLRAASLGIPTEADEWPAYVNLRLLVPTDDVPALSDELDGWLRDFSQAGVLDAYRLFDGPGFVRAELAVPYDGAATVDGVDAEDWIDELDLDRLQPPVEADFRPTPAYDAFVDGDAPLGVWAPVESLRSFATYELLELFAQEYRRVADSGKPRFSLQGVARLAAASVADDPLSAETEDLSLLLRADDDGVLFVDYYATRTALGAKLMEARSTPMDLPILEGLNSFIELSGQADLVSVSETSVQPHWTSLDDSTDFAGADFDVMADSRLPFTDDLSGLVALTMALQYPWTTLAIAGDSISFIPLPSGLRVHIFDGGPAGPLPASIALVGLFDDAPGTHQAIEMLLAQGDDILPGMLDAELVVRSDDRLELRAAVGTQLSDAFGESATNESVEGTQLSIDMAALQQALPGLATATEAVEFFGHIHLRGHSEDHYTTQRLTIGAEDAVDAAPLESRLDELAAASQRCRTELATLATEHLDDLRTAPRDLVDTWAEELLGHAQECLGSDHRDLDLIEERVDMARTLADEIP